MFDCDAENIKKKVTADYKCLASNKVKVKVKLPVGYIIHYTTERPCATSCTAH